MGEREDAKIETPLATGVGKSRREHLEAASFAPLVTGILIPAILYFCYAGTNFLFRSDAAQSTPFAIFLYFSAVVFFAMRWALKREAPTLARLELAALVTNILIYAAVTSNMWSNPVEEKLVLFIIIAMVFSIYGVSTRLVAASVLAAIGTMIAFTWVVEGMPVRRNIGIALIGVLAACSAATLLRGAVRRQIEARLKADDLAAISRKQAITDSLTGIPNRLHLIERVDQLAREGKAFWLALIDLDGFKTINDLYGHSAGDLLLVEVGAKLSARAAPDVTVGRLGGDEFAILIERDWTGEDVERFGNDLIADLSSRTDRNNLNVIVSACCGFAHYPGMADTPRAVYEKADFALFKAKAGRRGRTLVFNDDFLAELDEHLKIELALREGNLAEELDLAFQPQYNINLKRIVGFEALARWKSPKIGNVPPDKFIAAAERAGIMQDITAILFRKALVVMKSWPDDIRLAFNLSAQDIGSSDTIATLVDLLKTSGIDPHRIEFEITETAVLSDFDAAGETLERLSTAGCRIALDDFGAGYSSFAYIDRLRLDKVKVDKSFVGKVSHSQVSSRIVKAIIELCRDLDLDCVLEGVETGEELLIVEGLRASLIQGYFFSRPVRADETVPLLAKPMRSMAA